MESCRSSCDSIGSEAECIIRGVPAGIGDPVFEKLDARLAQAVCSIGAVKALDIGDGHLVCTAKGSENNDPFMIRNGHVEKRSNHAGGILGGISDGSDIKLHVYFKPTPSISALQHTVTKGGLEKDISIHGRHDPVIAPRAAVVVEAMAAITLFDSMLINMSARMDRILAFYTGTHTGIKC